VLRPAGLKIALRPASVIMTRATAAEPLKVIELVAADRGVTPSNIARILLEDGARSWG